jgi:hypothetical protein
VNVTLTLTAEQVEQIAERVAELLSANATPAQAGGLVDAQTVADALGMSRDTVYEHAAELGGRRIGDGERPRWRFDLEQARNAWQPAGEPTRTRPRRRQSLNGNARHLLPVHGEADR